MACLYAFVLALLVVSASASSKAPKVKSGESYPQQSYPYQQEYDNYYPLSQKSGKNVPVYPVNVYPSNYVNQKQGLYQTPYFGNGFVAQQGYAYPYYGQYVNNPVYPYYSKEASQKYYPGSQYQQVYPEGQYQYSQNQAYPAQALNNLLGKYFAQQQQQYQYQPNQIYQGQYYPGQNYQVGRVANNFPSVYGQNYAQGFYQGPYEQYAY